MKVVTTLLTIALLVFCIVGGSALGKDAQRIFVGQKAPGFTLPVHSGGEISLSDYLGQKSIVLVFYPLAFTPVCMDELLQFSEDYAEFQQRQAEILAISNDHVRTIREFAKTVKAPYPLLSDRDNIVLRAYDVYLEGEDVAQRSLFVVDKEGVVRFKHVYLTEPADLIPNAKLLEILDGL